MKKNQVILIYKKEIKNEAGEVKDSSPDELNRLDTTENFSEHKIEEQNLHRTWCWELRRWSLLTLRLAIRF